MFWKCTEVGGVYFFYLFLFLKIIISDHVQQTCDFVAFAFKLQ